MLVNCFSYRLQEKFLNFSEKKGTEMQKKIRIGLFDSGVGGLTVLCACRRVLPQAEYFYYGDNFHAPYGSRSKEEIEAFVTEGLEALKRHKVDAAVLACNTATAVCAEAMRKKFSFPILGMEPAVKPAAEKYRDILVLATPRTAESERLRELVGRFPDRRITVCALPGLAGAIEAHLTKGTPLTLSDHLPAGIFPQAVVLGCTHYTFFRREISAFYNCEVFDGGEGTARRLFSLLKIGRRDHPKPPDIHFQPPPSSKNFSFGGVIFLGKARKMNKKLFYSNVCSII